MLGASGYAAAPRKVSRASSGASSVRNKTSWRAWRDPPVPTPASNVLRLVSVPTHGQPRVAPVREDRPRRERGEPPTEVSQESGCNRHPPHQRLLPLALALSHQQGAVPEVEVLLLDVGRLLKSEPRVPQDRGDVPRPR